MSGIPDAKPLFHVETRDKQLGLPVLFNFYASKYAKYPPQDYTEQELLALYIEHGPEIPGFHLPFTTGPFVWSETEDGTRAYLIEILINDRFAKNKVMSGKDLILHFQVACTMLGCEKMLLDPSDQNAIRLGHKLDLDFKNYSVRKGKMAKSSNKLVDNRTKTGDQANGDKTIRVLEERLNSTRLSDLPFDLFYRPGSRLMTFSLETEKRPESISFNDDRLVVKVKDQNTIDIFLPFTVDLSEPVKYKFDERYNLFRAVFKIDDTNKQMARDE